MLDFLINLLVVVGVFAILFALSHGGNQIYRKLGIDIDEEPHPIELVGESSTDGHHWNREGDEHSAGTTRCRCCIDATGDE